MLTVAAFYFNPGLQVARQAVHVAEAGKVTAAERPNPSLNIAAGYATFPGAPWVFEFLPSVPIETAGKRRHRIELANREAEAARFAFGEAAWQVRTQLRQALVDYFDSSRRIGVFRTERDLDEATVNVYAALLRAGEEPGPPLAAARSQLDTADVYLRTAEGARAASRAAVAEAIGLPVAALEGLTLTWQDYARPRPVLAPAPVQRSALLNRLDVCRALADYASADAALRLEVARQYPNINLNPAYQFEEGANMYTIGPALVLPVLNHNQGPIAESEAQRKQAADVFLDVQAAAAGETERALAAYRGALAALDDASTLVAQRTGEVRFERALVQRGETSQLSLLAASLQRAGADAAWVDAVRNSQTALGALETAMERPMDPGWALPPLTAPAAGSGGRP